VTDSSKEGSLRRLEDALEVYLREVESGTIHREQVLREHQELREELEPMLDAGPPPPGTIAPPPELARDYEILREIGRGGMGIVYEAEQRALRRRVALKVLPASRALSASSVVRFRREAATAAAFDHDNIVKVLASATYGDTHCFAMELIEGETLAEGIAARRGAGGLPDAAEIRRAVGIAVQVASALQHAHERGVLHRDVKPGNVLLRADGRAVLTDFGLARDVATPGVTATGDLAGTPHYMAPEQVRGGPEDVDARADLWALGATLYEMVTLSRPFEAATPHDVLRKIDTEEAPDPRRANPGLPGDLVAILQKALERDRGRRYASAADFAADLQAFLEGRPVRARRIGTAGRLWRTVRRAPKRAAAIAGGIAGVVLLGGAVWWALAAQAASRAQRLEELLLDAYQELGEGERARAEQLLQRAFQLAPSSEEVIAARATLASLQGGARAALRVLDDQAEVVARSEPLRRRRAQLLRDAGRVAEAEAIERELAPPASAFDLFVLGARELQLGHAGEQAAFARAADLLQRALKAGGPRALYCYEWAHAAGHARDRGQIAQAQATIETYWPREARSWFWIGFAHSETDLVQAIAALRRAVELVPDYALAWLNLGIGHKESGEPPLARAAFERCLKLRPEEPRAYRQLADLLEIEGEPAAARQVVERGLARFPHDVLLRRQHARALLSLGELPGARARAEELLAADRQDLDALYVLAQLAEREGDRERASALVRQMEASGPQVASAWYQIGVLRGRLGERREAGAAYERALAIQPGHAESAVNLGNLLAAAGKNEQAAELFARALQSKPALQQARTGVLRGLIARGDREPVLRFCREWVAHAPTQVEAHKQLAWRVLGLDDGVAQADAAAIDEAGRALQRAQELAGGKDGSVLWLVGELQLLQGQPEQARTTLRRAQELLTDDVFAVGFYRQRVERALQRAGN
jgi:tetratricopeptide (TPR) repeat protein